MSCNYRYKDVSITFQSCSGQPGDAGSSSANYKEIGPIPLKVMRVEGTNGYHRDMMIRAIPWDSVPLEHQRFLLENGRVGFPLPAQVYEAYYLEEADNFQETPDTVRYASSIFATPVEAVADRFPWTYYERWGADVVVPEGRDHPLFLEAASIREAEKHEARIARDKEAQLKAEQENEEKMAESAFWEKMSGASDHVKASPAVLSIRLLADFNEYEKVPGFIIRHRETNKPTGLTVHKNSTVLGDTWTVSHQNSGAYILTGVPTKTEAVAAAFAFSRITDFAAGGAGEAFPPGATNDILALLSDMQKYMGIASD